MRGRGRPPSVFACPSISSLTLLFAKEGMYTYNYHDPKKSKEAHFILHHVRHPRSLFIYHSFAIWQLSVLAEHSDKVTGTFLFFKAKIDAFLYTILYSFKLIIIHFKNLFHSVY